MIPIFYVIRLQPPLFQKVFTPLLHKDAIESNGCSHKKAVSDLFRILSKGLSWIDPGDDIDFTAVPLWVRV
jgi:hypothetical protein